jgi:hypothetical protein
MECRRCDMESFLNLTLATVPAGAESGHLDLDTPIERLLDGV